MTENCTMVFIYSNEETAVEALSNASQQGTISLQLTLSHTHMHAHIVQQMGEL